MKRFLASLLIVTSFYAFSASAKTDPTPRDSASLPTQNIPSALSPAMCVAKVGLSQEDRVVYDHLLHLVPDAFCCTKSDVDERVACLKENAKTIRYLREFSIFFNFDPPLPPVVNCNTGIENLESAVGEVKCELSQLTNALL
jgi:hypothetical protein